MVVSDKSYRVIGTRPVRPDGVDKVTGRAQYGGDVRLAGMLYGRVLRSPHAHARIVKIDASKALQLSGVRAVVTADDLPLGGKGTVLGSGDVKYLRENVLASSQVLYVGHAVAAVCATDPHIAEDALGLIEVEYELLPHIDNVRSAMAPDAPIMLDDLRTQEPDGSQGEEPTNTAIHIQYELGDTKAAFSTADVVLEREYETTMVHQGYIEPQNGTAYWSTDGQLNVWTSTQGLFIARDAISKVLNMPTSRIKLNPVEIGGGFGGKIPIYLEPLAALLSKKSARPVKLVMSRQDVFEGTGPTCGSYMRIKLGAMRDGRIIAAEAYLAFEAGAFPGSPISAGTRTVFGPYDIANQLIDGYDVIVNKPKVSAYRAPGAPASEFAAESAVNELAEQLQIDPLELRKMNAAQEGTLKPEGFRFGEIGNEQCINAAINSPHYSSEITGENRGRGVASGFWFNAGLESSAFAQVNDDGTVSLVLGSTDIGGTRASLAMQMAETLGIEMEDVKPHVTDTDSVGFTNVTGGSRTTFAGGWAAHEAAMDIRRQLEERAATIWECPSDDVHYGDDGMIRGPEGEDGEVRSISFRDLAGVLQSSTGGMVVGRSDLAKAAVGPAFATHIVDVEVDPDTGKVTILRYTAIQDVGTAIHPSYVEGQIQGGVAQGIGMALNEEYVYDATGRMVNSTLLDYRMPTALDLPMIDTVLVECPYPGHPYGVRGVGEVPIVPPAPAVQAAIADAIGLRFNRLPMSPQVILEATLSDVD